MEKVLKLCEAKTVLPSHMVILMERMGKERNMAEKAESPVQPDNSFFLPRESDVVFAVALVTALEEGFRLDDTNNTVGYDKKVLESLELGVPPFRKENGFYDIEMRLPQSKDWSFNLITNSVAESCSIVNITASEKKVVKYLLAKAISNARLKLSAKRGQSLIRNIAAISSEIREIMSAVRREVLRANRVVFADIIGVPDEIKRMIFRHLKTRDFIALCSTNTFMYQYINEEDIWKYFLKRDFNADPSEEKGALDKYKDKYNSRMTKLFREPSAYTEESFRYSSDTDYLLPFL